MKIHIIGSGIIGLFTAYYLVKEGHEVYIIEQSDGKNGCSFENAGMIVPSHFIPLAAPGMVKKGFKWMFDNSSPFYVKPRFNCDFFSWAYRFNQSATKQNVEKASPILKEVLLYSQTLYQQIKDVELDFETKGLLMLCQKENTLKEEIEVAHKAHDMGMKADILDRDGVHLLEPNSKTNVCGGVFYPDDTHCNPQVLFQNLKTFLLNNKVTFKYNSKVTAATINNGKVDSLKIENEDESIKIEHLVLAAGSWSGELAKTLGLHIPMEAGKGYSFTQQQVFKNEIRHPSLLCEAKVAVTPFLNNAVRFAGTMELSGINQHVNLKRVMAITESGRRFYPENDIKMPAANDIWLGLRPCSPDGLPYIGRDKKMKNVVLATGHAMLGISMAAATGKLVAEILQEEKPSIDLELFGANRFD